MKKTKFMSLIAILLLFVVALTCGFLFACGNNDEDDVTDDGTVEENPTDPTDPTEPTEPTEYEGEILVSIYDGTAEKFGGNGCFADFTNLHELTVDATAASDGSAIYAIEGMATLMTKSQIYAFNAGENEDGAKTGDAFIMVAIDAPEGSAINYNGVEVEVTSDPTDGVFIQKITEDGKTDKSVTITYEDGTTVSFIITLEKVDIPSDYIIGTWSNVSISATAYGITATASVELIVDESENYALTITNISAAALAIFGLDLSEEIITMEGTWAVSEDGTYTLTGEAGNEVTVTLADGENGECCLTMSFTMDYALSDLFSITITVPEATLTAGALALESSDDGDAE